MRHVWMMILFFQRSLSDHFNLVYPHDPVVADLGSNVTLLCSTKPSMDLENMEVEWIRPDLNKAVVHRYKDKQDKTADQNSNYTGRTELFKEALKWGNTSLLLKNVKVSDEGRYTCGVQGNGVYRTNTFNVTVRRPRISVLSSDGSGEIRLQCESTGWQSEPKLQWMDSEGKVLSAGKTDLHNDGFMARSNITVRRSDSSCCFICSVSSGEKKQKALINISGIGTTPKIRRLDTRASGEIVLQCESQDWLDAPDLQWLDSDRNELSTGSKQLKKENNLFSVNRSITVHKGDANNFYCRVKDHPIMEASYNISDFLVDPHGPVVADLGYDVILPCSIKPPMKSVIKEVEWIRPDLNKTVVHRYNTTVDYQDPEYRGRTELFKEGLQWGNTSLLLKNVKVSDEGRYTCGVQTQDACDIITLDVIIKGQFSVKWILITIVNIIVFILVLLGVIRYYRRKVKRIKEEKKKGHQEASLHHDNQTL